MADYYERLEQVARGLHTKYPEGNDPFKCVTRLCEEAGELAQQVNHIEETGRKVEKYGPPDKQALADEIHHVLRAALHVAQYYHVEDKVKESIDEHLEKLRADGYVEE